MNRLKEILEREKRKKPKYGNVKIDSPDGTFDSMKEFNRWQELKLLQRAGEITGLERQYRFELIPSQKGDDGKIAERAVVYVADFVYIESRTNRMIVEDVKAEITKTAEYRIKRKLMLWRYNIRIREV